MIPDGEGLTVRSLAGLADLGVFTRLPGPFDRELAGDLAEGHRRPGWLWMALRGDRLLARAGWWGQRGRSHPSLLDVFDLDDRAGPPAVAAAARLLAEGLAAVTAPGRPPPEYSLLAEPGWRERPRLRAAAEARMRAAEAAGATFLVERLRLEWRLGTPVPGPGGRLSFRPPASPQELVPLMTAVLDGTLDAHGRADLARMPPARAAARHYTGELMRYASPRDWWRVACLPGGEPAGFVVPAHNGYAPVIAYVGVLPAHRGRGYIGEILAEGTRVLAATGATRIQASTDLPNVPMAAAFHRAGWITTGHEINMVWDEVSTP